MRNYILIGIMMMLAGCAGQTPLQGIAGGIDKLKDNQLSEQVRVWAEDALIHADAMALDPIQKEQARACSNAILQIQPQKKVLLDRWKAHMLALDAQISGLFNPIILAQEVKFGKDPIALVKADEKEIIGWGEYLMHSCSNLFPTAGAIDLARKFFGVGL